MGILNVNTDSFSDPRDIPNAETDVPDLTRLGIELWQHGAALVDVGAESASPATPVADPKEEIDALLPVLDGLHRAGVATSVDTYKPSVAQACTNAGVTVINDYSGLAHPEIAGICAASDVPLVITHNPGGVKNKVLDPEAYPDIITDVVQWFESRLKLVETYGLRRERIVLDPGIDLAKTPTQSIEILRGLPALASFGLPLLVAISRKDFIGTVSPSTPAERGPGTLAALGHLIGIPRVIARVHDIPAAVQYLRVTGSLAGQLPLDPQVVLQPQHRREAVRSVLRDDTATQEA